MSHERINVDPATTDEFDCRRIDIDIAEDAHDVHFFVNDFYDRNWDFRSSGCSNPDDASAAGNYFDSLFSGVGRSCCFINNFSPKSIRYILNDFNCFFKCARQKRLINKIT